MGEHSWHVVHRLDHGAEALLRDADGETALHKARKQVHKPCSGCWRPCSDAYVRASDI